MSKFTILLFGTYVMEKAWILKQYLLNCSHEDLPHSNHFQINCIAET